MTKGNVIILILGIIAIGAGIFIYFEAASFQNGARLTEGKVVHVIGSSYSIQYVTDDGTVKIKQGSGKTHGFREGANAKVWYSISNPDRARLSDGKKGSRKIIIAGAFCILLGIYPLFLKKGDTPRIPAS
jgi:hypothetical protein